MKKVTYFMEKKRMSFEMKKGGKNNDTYEI